LSAFTTLQVLVDADNVFPGRLQPVLDLVAGLARPVSLVAAGRPAALERLRWPDGTTLIAAAGWQSADLVLAQAYSSDADPLLLITGDGDFALLAARHPGAVLVISGAPSQRLRDVAAVVDPAVEGLEPVKRWLAAV